MDSQRAIHNRYGLNEISHIEAFSEHFRKLSFLSKSKIKLCDVNKQYFNIRSLFLWQREAAVCTCDIVNNLKRDETQTR